MSCNQTKSRSPHRLQHNILLLDNTIHNNLTQVLINHRRTISRSDSSNLQITRCSTLIKITTQHHRQTTSLSQGPQQSRFFSKGNLMTGKTSSRSHLSRRTMEVLTNRWKQTMQWHSQLMLILEKAWAHLACALSVWRKSTHQMQTVEVHLPWLEARFHCQVRIQATHTTK